MACGAFRHHLGAARGSMPTRDLSFRPCCGGALAAAACCRGVCAPGRRPRGGGAVRGGDTRARERALSRDLRNHAPVGSDRARRQQCSGRAS